MYKVQSKAIISNSNLLYFATEVCSWSPCHLAISSLSIEFTNLCCLIMLRPLNFSDVTLMANIEPQPPEMSMTSSD